MKWIEKAKGSELEEIEQEVFARMVTLANGLIQYGEAKRFEKVNL